MTGGQIVRRRHLRVVRAAKWLPAICVRPHRVAQVQVDVRQVKNLCRWRALLDDF
jgi:hypothetical protein